MTCEIANVMTETPIITAAIPTMRRPKNARKRTERYRLLFRYRCEIRPIHRAPNKALHVRAKTELRRRLIEDHVGTVVQDVVGDLFVRRRALCGVGDQCGVAALRRDRRVVPAVTEGD